jgi:hypothetical protein
MNLLRKTLLGLAFALPAVCFAQWQWIDKDGRKVFSDKSPPPEIPAKSILRQPGSRVSTAPSVPAATAADTAASAAQVAKSAASAPKLSGKDKELEEKRKKAEAADAEKKKAQEEEVAKQRAENCTYARRNKATFDSGVRIARTNDKGEREFMDDATRAAESKRVEAIIARDCKAPGG